MKWGIQVEDLRNHGAEAVMTLRHLLTCGAKITPDPKRAGFYEVESDSTVYYIYALSTNGKVALLATWPSESALAVAAALTIRSLVCCLCSMGYRNAGLYWIIYVI